MEYNDLSKLASEATRQIHQAMKTLLDFDDPHEKECVLRNCLKKVENLEIKNAEGEVIWSQRIACLDQELAPGATVILTARTNSATGSKQDVRRKTPGIWTAV